MQNFPHHGRESGSFVLFLLKLFQLFASLQSNCTNSLDVSAEFSMIHSRNVSNDLCIFLGTEGKNVILSDFFFFASHKLNKL